MRFTLWVWCCWISLSVLGHSGDLFLFQSTLHDKAVTMEVSGNEQYWNLRYFDHETLRDHYLSGIKQDSTWTFHGKNAAEEELVIRFKQKWTIKGHTAEGKVKEVMDYFYPEEAEKAYFRAKVERMVFEEQGREERLILVKELKSGMIFFRSTIEKINQELKKIHVNMAFKALSCEWRNEVSPIEINYEIFRHDSTYLSYRLEVIDNCSENYTDHNTIYRTWDITTQEEIKLEDLVYFGVGKAPDFQTQSWFTYRYQKFPGYLMPLLEIEVECLSDKTLWQFPDWYLKADGICFLPFSFNKEGCDFTTPRCVSWDKLAAYLKK